MDLSRTCPLFVLSLLKRFLALLAPGYNQGMDVERSCRAPAAFRESCRAAFYTVLVLISVPLAIAALVEWRTFPAVAGTCFAAIGIRLLVRWLNRHDDLRVKCRAPNPGGPSESK